MQSLAHLLGAHQLVLLFVVVVFGLGLSRLQVGGVRLGIAGVLFAGLGLAAWIESTGNHASLAPELKEFGLILFVYCVGLSSGSGFFSAFRARGLKLNVVLILALLAGTSVAVLGGHLLGLRRGLIAGIFCGALTNTPALGAATDVLRNTAEQVDPVLGYSISYPFGVLGALIAFRSFLSVQRRAFEKEKEEHAPASQTQIASASCVVLKDDVVRHSIGELQIYKKRGVIVSRLQRGTTQLVPTKYTVFEPADVITIVGSQHAVREAIEYFGEAATVHLEQDREQVDMRRILVSKRALAGLSIAELDLERKFNAQVTRLRRADLDLIPSPDLRVTLGDRLRVVAPREKLPEVAKYFGDSERELAAIDFVALTIGVTTGLLVGLIPMTVFGTQVTLGAAGGPLVVALILGRLGRTGPFNWTLPFEVNQTLRELGLLLFLAGVGVSAGGALSKMAGAEGLSMLGLGAVVTLVTSLVALGLARKLAHASVITSMGVTSGMGTQPATLAAAYELSERSEETYVAYALVYPVAMIGKILLAQLIAALA